MIRDNTTHPHVRSPQAWIGDLISRIPMDQTVESYARAVDRASYDWRVYMALSSLALGDELGYLHWSDSANEYWDKLTSFLQHSS